ncbi:D-alanyl-D-alanine carboxypeptidase/D-alanyl-D-alanine-endopeptidase [Spirochaetota bacterium]
MNLVLIFFCFSLSALFACKGKSPGEKIFIGHDQRSLKTGAISKSKIPPGNIGYILYDLDRKSVVTSHNRNKALIPSSTTKILTTTAALNTLGADYRFKTLLCYTGRIKSGVLKGDLYLKGSGDPLFRVTNLMNMAEALKKSGIKKVLGNFYYDESALYSSNKIDDIMNADASYNPGLSALSLDFNVIYARWKPLEKKKIEKKMKNKIKEIFLIPSLPINRVAVSNVEFEEKRKFKFSNFKGREKWHLSARIAKKAKEGKKRLPVKNPALYTATVFAKLCRLKGASLPPPKPKKVPRDHDILFTNNGMPLIRLAELTLLYSNNLMAELILLGTAKKISGKVMDLEKSARILEDFFSEKIKNVNWKGLYLNNGSGLTSDNRISPEQLLAVLLYANSFKYDGRSYLSLLPISGWRGSLFRRLNKPDTAFRVWAKTGSINYAVSLAGYLFTKSNKKMLFVIIINDMDKRKYFDKHPNIRFNKRTRRAIHWWTKKNKDAIDDILSEWIKKI